MSKQNGRQLNAVKHGAFARDAVLPGESRQDFEELYRSLLNDLAAEGRFEEETVLSITRLIWAKERLERWNRAKVDEARIKEEIAPLKAVAFFDPNPSFLMLDQTPPGPEDLDAAISRCPEPYCSMIRKELGAKKDVEWSFDEYVETATKCAANLLGQFRQKLQVEPNSTDYQQPIVKEIEGIQTEYINAVERLDAMIDRQFKRMLQSKAYKQICKAHQDAQKTIEALPNERKSKNAA